MDKFFHIRILISIIIGLSLTHLLRGIVKFIEHPTRQKVYFVHLLWSVYLFIMIIHFWWWEFGLTLIQDWSFLNYFYIIAYTIFFYVDAAILFPENMAEYANYKEYFFSRRKWFFGVLALIYSMDIIDTMMKGHTHLEYLGIEYFIGAALGVMGCLTAILIRNERFHAIFVIAFIIYRMVWIYRSYYWMEGQAN